MPDSPRTSTVASRRRDGLDELHGRGASAAETPTSGEAPAALSRLLLEPHVLGLQRAVLGGAPDEVRELVGVEGLDDVVVGARP